jgi:hypothetical protein
MTVRRLALLTGFLPLLASAADQPARSESEQEIEAAEPAAPVEVLDLPDEKRGTFGLGLRIGGMLALQRASATDRVGAAPGAGLYGFFDSRYFLADVGAEFAKGGRNHATNLGAGIYFPFLEGNTPYLGGGAAMSWATFGGQGASGPRVHGAAGVLLNRTAAFAIRGELGYFLNLFQETERVTWDPTGRPLTGTAKFTSHGAMLWVGVIL